MTGRGSCRRVRSVALRAEGDEQRIGEMARRAERTAREVREELVRVRYTSTEQLASMRRLAVEQARLPPPPLLWLSPCPGPRSAALDRLS